MKFLLMLIAAGAIAAFMFNPLKLSLGGQASAGLQSDSSVAPEQNVISNVDYITTRSTEQVAFYTVLLNNSQFYPSEMLEGKVVCLSSNGSEVVGVSGLTILNSSNVTLTSISVKNNKQFSIRINETFSKGSYLILANFGNLSASQVFFVKDLSKVKATVEKRDNETLVQLENIGNVAQEEVKVLVCDSKKCKAQETSLDISETKDLSFPGITDPKSVKVTYDKKTFDAISGTMPLISGNFFDFINPSTAIIVLLIVVAVLVIWWKVHVWRWNYGV